MGEEFDLPALNIHGSVKARTGLTTYNIIGLNNFVGGQIDVSSVVCYIYFNCNLKSRAHKNVFKGNNKKNNYDKIDAIIRG